jgi:hypothetical protein
VCDLKFKMYKIMLNVLARTVSWHRWLVTGLSLQRPRSEPRPVPEGFVEVKVEVGQVFLTIFICH